MATRAYEPAPLDSLLAVLPSLPRPLLARLTARLIDRLDELDGDPDLECPNDEDVPHFPKRRRLRNSQRRRADPLGPGCPIADQDYGIEDMGEGTPGLDCP
jgi:hypothetical protein